MLMPAPAHVWTLDEMHALPEDGNKYELLYGELIVSPAPAPSHEEIVARLNELLVPYVIAERLGRVYTPRSVIRREGSEVEPDLMVRQPLTGDDWERMAVPLLVVEVESPRSRRHDNGKKRRFYSDDVGVGEYWVVSRARNAIVVTRKGHPDQFVADGLSWHPVGAGAALKVSVQHLLTSSV